MFANLKKKIEEGATPVTTTRKSSVSGSTPGSATKVPSSSSYIHGEADTPLHAGSAKRTSVSSDLLSTKHNESTASSSQADDVSKDIVGSKEELMDLLMKRTRQIKTMEAKYQDLTSVLKEKTAMIEKLESALEKQQDVHCQRIHELNERYNGCRAKLSETVAAAVRKKEEEMKQQFKELEQSKQELEEKVRRLEAFQDKVTERQDTKDELDAFATQELTKVKHLLLNAEEELQRLKAEKKTSTDVPSVPSGSNDIVRSLYDQIAELKSTRSELEAKNAELCESVASLKATCESLKTQLQDSKESLANIAGSQDEWLEKQIESEKSISTLEQQIRSLKTDLTQSETSKTSLMKQLDDRATEITNLKSAVETLKSQCDSQQSTVDKHSAVVAELEKCRQQAIDECMRLERELTELTSRHETARNEYETLRSTSETELKLKQETVDSLEERLRQLHDECSALQQRLDELEQLHSSIAADVEANVTAKFKQEITSLEDQLVDKNRSLKKQDQRLSDLKKLLQRELKVQPPPHDDVIISSGPPLPPSGMSSSHLYLDSLPAAPTSAPSAFIPSVHTSAVHHSTSSTSSSHLGDGAEPSSPATISVSDVPYRNGQHDSYMPSSVAGLPMFHADEISRLRSGRRTSSRGTSGGQGSSSAVMCAADSDYDFMRELNFTYLRHVVLKFMLSREAEAMQLIKAVSMLLHFTPEEQKLIHDTLEWKMSWFGARPQLPAKGQTAKIIPPSY